MFAGSVHAHLLTQAHTRTIMYMSTERFLHSPGHDCICKSVRSGQYTWRTQLHLTPAGLQVGRQTKNLEFIRDKLIVFSSSELDLVPRSWLSLVLIAATNSALLYQLLSCRVRAHDSKCGGVFVAEMRRIITIWKSSIIGGF